MWRATTKPTPPYHHQRQSKTTALPRRLSLLLFNYIKVNWVLERKIRTVSRLKRNKCHFKVHPMRLKFRLWIAIESRKHKYFHREFMVFFWFILCDRLVYYGCDDRRDNNKIAKFNTLNCETCSIFGSTLIWSRPPPKTLAPLWRTGRYCDSLSDFCSRSASVKS